MDISVADAKDQLPELIRAVAQGEQVVLMQDGRAVAQIAPPPPERRRIQWGSMRDQIKLLPGWDDPVDLDRFLDDL